MTPAELRAAADRVNADTSFQYDGWYDDLCLLFDAARRLAAIQEAWVNPGPMPSIHRSEQSRLRRDWPTLARAIEHGIR